MTSFGLNVLASLLGALLLLLGASVISRRARWVLTGLLGRLLDVDIDYVYQSKEALEKDLEREFRISSAVDIFTGRGNEFQRRAFSPLFLERPRNRNVRVRILLPQTKKEEGACSWTEQREQEVASFDPAFGKGLLDKQIEANIHFLQPHVASGDVELRCFNYPHIGRLIVTDRSVFWTPYQADAHGRDSRIYRFRRGCDLARNLERMFEQLWSASSECVVGAEGMQSDDKADGKE